MKYFFVDVCGYLKGDDKKKLVHPYLPPLIVLVPHDDLLLITVPITIGQIKMEPSGENNDYDKEKELEAWQSGEPHLPN